MAEKSKVKSNYVKHLMKNLERTEENKEYIQNLVWLERRVLKNVTSLGHIIFFRTLENKYKFDFEVIFKELDYKGYQKHLIEQKMLEDHFLRWHNESGKPDIITDDEHSIANEGTAIKPDLDRESNL